jgi:hypothetical protein
MLKVSSTILLIVLNLLCFAQVRTSADDNISNIDITAVEISNDNLLFSEKIFLKEKAIPIVNISNLKTRVLSDFKVKSNLILPNSFEPEVIYAVEQKRPIAYFNVPRFIKNNNGTVTELIRFDKTIQEGNPAATTNTRGNRIYASNSILATGDWYKFAITKTGICKLDYNFIKSLGIDVDNIVPNNIRVYGNGGGMLAEDNKVLRPDDLLENAIELVGMEDGKFNTNDYVLVYVVGPHKVVIDTLNKSMSHEFNIYSNQSAYFINVNLGPGKRVNTNNTAAIPTITINTSYYYDFYEKDSFNFNQLGKEWFGEQFSNRLADANNLNFSFNIPQLLKDSVVNFNIRLSSMSNAGNSRFNVTANGALLSDINMPVVGKEFYDKKAYADNVVKSAKMSSDNINVLIKYTPGNEYAIGALGSIGINAQRALSFNGGAIPFLNFNTINEIAAYNISTTIPCKVWDITFPNNAIAMSLSDDGSKKSFVYNTNKLKQFIVFDDGNVTPIKIGKIENQNLHNSIGADFIIITHPSFLSEANRLAAHHTERGSQVAVATTEQIYNEFSSGVQDITALRDYIKMFYDKAPINDLPQNVLLFGDASFDYKDRIRDNTNYVPTRNSDESQVRINVNVSDDYFGILDDNEQIGSSDVAATMDIGVGRITASSLSEARTCVDKCLIYNSPKSFGSWKNTTTLVTDDMDTYGSIHLDDGELMSQVIKDSMGFLNAYKIYLDAFQIQPLAGGFRSPQAQSAINAQIFNGTLVMNYNGHGSPAAWTEERIFTIDNISEYNNINKLAVYVTATCDFAPFEQPSLKSAGEQLLSYNKGGAIALLTTTQSVFQSENRRINKDWWNSIHTKTNGNYPTFGESIRRAKNQTYSNKYDENFLINFRKFVLLGNPALTLNIPVNKVTVDSINDLPIGALITDTVRALSKCKIAGSVTDQNDNLLSDFNGEVELTIFDKPKNVRTLTTNPRDPKRIFAVQNTVVFKGKADVVKGRYELTFVTPRDINYAFGAGKVSLYANDNMKDATGVNFKLIVGGSSNSTIVDNDAPLVRPFLNDTNFVNGGITGPNTLLILKLSDSNGINASGAGVGHDITAILDGNTQEVINLNNFYNGDKGNYKSGIVQYPIRNLTPGRHTLSFKAWDVFNNSGTASLDFIVTEANKPTISRVVNYPNPFTTKTNFWFEHNYPGELIYVTINIFTISGKIVKTITKAINSTGTQVREIEWDGKDEFGDKLGKGVYMYQLNYKTASGFSANKLQKLVIL